MENKIKNSEKELLEQIVGIIVRYKKPQKVVLYGSRARGIFKESSDIDIAIFGKDWTSTDINLVKHELDESVKTPLKIDVVNFYQLKKEPLKENILKEGRILYEQ